MKFLVCSEIERLWHFAVSKALVLAFALLLAVQLVGGASAHASGEEDDSADELEERLEAILEEQEDLEELEEELEDELEKKLEDDLESDLEDQLEDLLDAADDLEEELEQELEDRFEEAMEAEEELEERLEENLEEEVEEGFEEGVEEGLENNLDDELEHELEPDLDAELEAPVDLPDAIQDEQLMRHLSGVEDSLDELYEELEPSQFISLLTEAQWQTLQAQGQTGIEVQALSALGLYLLTSLEPLAPEMGVEVTPDHLYQLDAQPAAKPVASTTVSSKTTSANMMSDDFQVMPKKAERRIGMMDSHILVDHPCLRDADITQQVFYDSDYTPDFTHGTAMAGLMVAAEHCAHPGRLKQAQVFNAVVFARHQKGYVVASAGQLIKGLDWLLQQQVQLINFSLSGPANPLLEQVLNRVYERGVHLLASVGNDGAGSFARYPSAYDSVMAITAVDAQYQIYPRAGRGDHVEFAMLGVHLPVLDATTPKPDATLTLSGTSLATALASAWLAALPISETKTTNSQIRLERERLQQQALDLGVAGRDPVFGFGILLHKMRTSLQNPAE